MTSLPLPLICITCLPPWPQAMMFAGKNLENRDANVAARLAPFVGQNIGISQSKGFTKQWSKHDAVMAALEIEFNQRHRPGFKHRDLGREEDWPKTAGKLILVARLDRIAKPSEYSRNPWHFASQHGLVLGKVWQVEPVTCTGGAGAWEPTWCVKCGHIMADNARAPLCCPKCKAIWPENRMTRKGMEHLNANCGASIERPQLRIVRECQ